MGKDFDFELDGAGLLDALLIAGNAENDKDNNVSIARLIKIFKKYGLNTFQGFAMLLEIAAAVGGKE